MDYESLHTEHIIESNEIACARWLEDRLKTIAFGLKWEHDQTKLTLKFVGLDVHLDQTVFYYLGNEDQTMGHDTFVEFLGLEQENGRIYLMFEILSEFYEEPSRENDNELAHDFESFRRFKIEEEEERRQGIN